jgi:hypothetical protein
MDVGKLAFNERGAFVSRSIVRDKDFYGELATCGGNRIQALS